MVAAAWDVDDEATARLMSDLYARLAQGTALPRALAAAQAECATAGEHPIDWAAFAVLGGPRLLSERAERMTSGSNDSDMPSPVSVGRTSFTSSQIVGIQQVPVEFPEVDLSFRGTAPLHSLQHRRLG